ncbi:MAG: hypothetical protein WCK02_18105 [Bacteroidota bacterium]
MGNFAYNNPNYIFPQTKTEDFALEAINIGHPLISKADCITNNFNISGWNQMTIVTGANMAGKSTFLRTIGTNILLGTMGAPVFADKFTFTPIEIYSSIRTSDSLAKNESYFYAELKRLKAIINELEKGIPKFILLDEILKGTNSQDKQSGSIELIKHLLQYHFVGIFATHDQALGELINLYPNNVKNACFEISFNNEQMIIDYKIRDGICKNLNATYLMKKMGIIS